MVRRSDGGMRRLSGLFILLVPLIAGPAQAASDEVTTLRREVEQLRQTVERLNQKVDRLEQRKSPEPATALPSAAAAPTVGAVPQAAAAASPVAAGSPTPTVQTLQENWDRVAMGMSVEQVEKLLGRPGRTIPLPGKTIWYYSYPHIGNGSVVFVENQVSDWRKPPFSPWW